MQKRTYIARMAQPSRANTRFIVFLAAGQQDVFLNLTPTRGGLSSGVTGQPSDFKDRFERKSGSVGDYSLRSGSLARWLIEDNRSPFPPNETFFAAAWDARFHQKFSNNEKNDILEAYADWLSEQFIADRTRMMYLAGHSRGGCLVMRLAKEMTRRYPNLPIIVHSFDGVCNRSGGEFGVSGTRIDNPVSGHSSAWGYSTNHDSVDEFGDTRVRTPAITT